MAVNGFTNIYWFSPDVCKLDEVCKCVRERCLFKVNNIQDILSTVQYISLNVLYHAKKRIREKFYNYSSTHVLPLYSIARASLRLPFAIHSHIIFCRSRLPSVLVIRCSSLTLKSSSIKFLWVLYIESICVY